VQALVKHSKCSDILEKETQALVQQWLEYIVICINYADVPINANRILNASATYMYIIYIKHVSYRKYNINLTFNYRN